MSRLPSAALPIAYVFLRILILLNWFFGACILALLIFSFANEPWMMRALHIATAPNPQALLMGMRAVAALGLASIPLNYALFKRLHAIIETVRAGDPFVAENAYRLQAIGWVLLALQLLGMAIGLIGRAVSTPGHELHTDAGVSPIGWLAVLLTFVLARVFAEGALMREDLEGTV